MITGDEQRRASQAALRTASNEQAAREASYLRALNPPPVPQPEPPQLRGPSLPDGFNVAQIDQAIFERGIAISKERLVSLGEERFAQLLLLDRETRQLQRVTGPQTDFTDWPSVAHAFASRNALNSGLAPRKTSEQFAGLGADREQAGQIEGFADLWKAWVHEPQTVKNVYRVRDAFGTLIFGRSLLEAIGTGGRVHSKFFCGGKGERVTYFRSWLGTLEGPHFVATLGRPLAHVVAWLCHEKTPILAPTEQAREWSNLRVPSSEQVRLAAAVIEGWLLGLNSWSLWNHVGRITRQPTDVRLLETWRAGLAKRHPAITQFHNWLKNFFWLPGSHEGYRRMDEDGRRDYMEQSLRRLVGNLSPLVCLALESERPVARFDDFVLFEGKFKPPLLSNIKETLGNAFNGHEFEVNIEQ
jgi:hypothetical protein